MRHSEAERVGGPHVDDELKLRPLLDRQVGWFGTIEDFSGVDALEPINLLIAWPVAEQAAIAREIARLGMAGTP